jgi:hypothetical protein
MVAHGNCVDAAFAHVADGVVSSQTAELLRRRLKVCEVESVGHAGLSGITSSLLKSAKNGAGPRMMALDRISGSMSAVSRGAGGRIRNAATHGRQ